MRSIFPPSARQRTRSIAVSDTLCHARFRAEFAVDKAEKAIERSIDATITSDWDAARTAVNLGKPIADVKPKSALVADISALVDRLMPDGVLAAHVPQMPARRKAS